MDIELCKQAVAEKAVELVEDGMIVGLGTGSTVFFFIQKLIESCRKGLRVQVVPTSQASCEQAKRGGLTLAQVDQLEMLDLCVDGADEVDPQGQLIKGAGGAFLREKIVATMSREMIVIIDETKQVAKLGGKPLPVEIIPFGHCSTRHQIELLGYRGTWRKNPDHSLFLTENRHLLFDIQLQPEQVNPSLNEQQLLSVPGVVETGFFLNIAGRILVGLRDGQVMIR